MSAVLQRFSLLLCLLGLGWALGPFPQDDPAIGLAQRQVTALDVVGSAPAHLDGEASTTTGKPARQRGIRRSAQVVGVADGGIAETSVQQGVQGA